MKRDTSSSFGILSGNRRGIAALLVRAGLKTASVPYSAAVRARNFYYGKWAFPAWLDVPVISVGNITVGGTGKTPMTIWLCEKLLARGRKPAVLSRGYKAEEGLADELLLISRRVPQAVAIANPNRYDAGRLAVKEYGAQVAVLDDGFQHRRMGRDLDIVLIDATRPFGFGHLLPRGLLREPIANLRRAEAIVITRCDQATPAALDDIRRQIERVNPSVPIARAIHQVIGFYDIDGVRRDLPSTARIGAFAGIARPDTFTRTLESLGHVPSSLRCFADHHPYTEEDLRALADQAVRDRLKALVTTEKDAVKLGRFRFDWPLPLLVLRVDMALLDDGDRMLTDAIDAMLKEHEEPHEPATA